MGKYYKENYIEKVEIDGTSLPCECYVEVKGGGKTVYTHNGIKEITGIKNRKVSIKGRLEGKDYSDLLGQIKLVMTLSQKTEALSITSMTTDAYGLRKIIIENEPNISLIQGFDNSRNLTIEADEEIEESVVDELIKEARNLKEDVLNIAKPLDKLYTVKKGDSLSKIALREWGDFNLWRSIYGKNRNIVGPDPNLIIEGTKINIPSLPEKVEEIRVKAGDTLLSLAKEYFYDGSYKDLIKKANEAKALVEGDILKIPSAINVKKRSMAKKYAARLY